MQKRKIVIDNEDFAIETLKNALRGGLPESFDFSFDNWPTLNIVIRGDGFQQTITAPVAAAIVELQKALNKSYCLVVYGENNTNQLTEKEKRALQFKAKIDKGSSLININLSSFAETLATTIAEKMEPTHLISTIIALGLITGGVFIYKSFLESKTKEKEIDAHEKTKIRMTEEETKRTQIFADTINTIVKNNQLSQTQFNQIHKNINSAKTEFLKSAANADSLSINGVEISGKTTRTLLTNKKQQARDVQLNGTYDVLTVDFRSSDTVKLRLKRRLDNKEFVASFQDYSFENDRIKILQNAEWGRKPVYLSINATELRGEITSATVISVDEQSENVNRDQSQQVGTSS